MRQISLFLDVEDPHNPESDDAVLEIAELFDRAGVRGNFCVTGDKCRALTRRGRSDVVAALAPHCLGLHTDTHSEHPTTMELLADLPYGEGCRLAYDAESRGQDAFVSLFGREPAFWGGAGNTWSPEVADALRRLGIPAYTYALTSVGGRIHRFNGVVALPQHRAVAEDSWPDTEPVLETGSQWSGVFLGHPTRFVFAEFWDKGHASGLTPSAAPRLARRESEDYRRCLAGLSRCLESLPGRFEVVTADQIQREFRAPTDEERAVFARETSAAIRAAKSWPIHRPDLDVENIVSKTLALADTLEVEM